MEKVGILGGVFDPIHIGHLHIADGALRILGLSKIIFIPSGDPPHKARSPFASGECRSEMILMATADNPAFDLSYLELNREGKSYTADTLDSLRRTNPDWKMYFIMGGDNRAEILAWKQPERIFALAEVVIVNRPGFDDDADIKLPWETIEIDLPGIDLSSSQIRRFIKDKIPCRYLLPPGVEDYIVRKGLYT